MQNEVIDFIKRRFSKDCNWRNGNCYYFALILKDRFPKSKIVYDVAYGHFFIEYENSYYDHSGKIEPPESEYIVYWEEFDKYDPLVKQRIIRDCIM